MTAPISAAPLRDPRPAAAAGAVSGGPARTTAPRSLEQQHAELRKAAHQLEGVFLAQLFAAMRGSESNPDPTVNGGQAGEMFRTMMDEQIAERAALSMNRGVGEALYRQLARGLQPLPDDANARPAGAP